MYGNYTKARDEASRFSRAYLFKENLMLTECEAQALRQMGLDIGQYQTATTRGKCQLLTDLRQQKLSLIHHQEEQIAAIDYLRAQLHA